MHMNWNEVKQRKLNTFGDMLMSFTMFKYVQNSCELRFHIFKKGDPLAMKLMFKGLST